MRERGKRSYNAKWFWKQVWVEHEFFCWLWNGKIDRKGYGFFKIGKEFVSAPRRAYEHKFGTVPRDLSVLHKCDNPRCVNPSHLFLGTAKDNMVDCATKGRIHKKLTKENVLEIRASTAPQKELASKFQVSPSTIRSVVRRETWAWLE